MEPDSKICFKVDTIRSSNNKLSVNISHISCLCLFISITCLSLFNGLTNVGMVKTEQGNHSFGVRLVHIKIIEHHVEITTFITSDQ